MIVGEGAGLRGYLHVRSGRLGVLLPVAGVLEVLEVARKDVTAEHISWRDGALPVVECSELLGEEAGGAEAAAWCTGVVYAPSPALPPTMLLVDRVAGLLSGGTAVPLLHAPRETARLFETTLAGTAGERLYCLRYPLDCLRPVGGGAAASPCTEAAGEAPGEVRISPSAARRGRGKRQGKR